MNVTTKRIAATAILFCTIVVAPGLMASARDPVIQPQPAGSMEPGWHEGALRHDGLQRVFRFYIPDGDSRNMPVVVLLHGGRGSMDELFQAAHGGTQKWVQLAEQENFLLLVPNGTDPKTGSPLGDALGWNDCRPGSGKRRAEADDVGFIGALLDWTAVHFAGGNVTIDPDRIYVTGASNGGMMTYRLITELPHRFAAAAAFIANRPANSECLKASAPVPLLIVNATRDPLMPYEGGNIPFDGGLVLPAEATRNYWIAVNHASLAERTTSTLPDRDAGDGSSIICETYPPQGTGGATVKFCRVEGAGHSMPSIEHPLSRFAQRLVGPQNHDIEGARFAWEFLKQFSQQRGP